MDSEYNSSKIFGHFIVGDVQSYYKPSSLQTFLPISDLMVLGSLFFVLIRTLVRTKKIVKLTDVVEFVSFNKKTGIPTVSFLWILKNILIHRTDFQKIAEITIEKYGEIFQINLLGIYNLVVVTNPSMVQKLYLSTKPGHLYKPKWYNKVLVGPLREGLVASGVETWKLHRSVISKAFGYNGLLRQINIIEEHVKRFILTLQESQKPCLSDPSISFEEQLHVLTSEIILHIAAGKEIHDNNEEERKHFHSNFEKVQELVSYRIYHPFNYVDMIWNCNPVKWELDRKLNELLKYSNKVIAKIRKRFDSNKSDGLETDDDMAGKSPIELMLRAGFSNDEIFVELTTLFAAGHETTSTTAKLLLFLLASNKEYQDKCRKEVDQMFGQMCASNSNEISLEALKSLTFLDICIKECLRLYPVIPAIARQLETPLQLDEDTYLPPGTIVITSPLIIQRNPKVYEEPERFYPERFSPEKIKNRGICEYMPFSVGPRNCIGFKSATIELKILVAYVLHNFEVSSEMSIIDLNQILRKTLWPFPDLDIKIHSRQ